MGAVNQSISVVTGQEFCDHHSTLVSFQSTDTLTEPLKMFPVCAGDAKVKTSQEAPPAPSRTTHREQERQQNKAGVWGGAAT